MSEVGSHLAGVGGTRESSRHDICPLRVQLELNLEHILYEHTQFEETTRLRDGLKDLEEEG